MDGADENRGQLESSLSLVETTRADTVHLRAHGLQLNLQGSVPEGLTVSAMMDALLPQLSPEFRVDKGARCGLQTTYLDEGLLVVRCLTGQLHGAVSVYSRVAA